jgi:hypothetical protein
MRDSRQLDLPYWPAAVRRRLGREVESAIKLVYLILSLSDILATYTSVLNN